MITSLIRKSKADYYVAFFEENKTDSKKTWEGIRNIVNISKKTKVVPNFVIYKGKSHFDKKEIAESFNDFFVNIGNTVENKIPQGKSHFSTYLGKANVKSLLIMPLYIIEVDSMISNLSGNKACGHIAYRTIF